MPKGGKNEQSQSNEKKVEKQGKAKFSFSNPFFGSSTRGKKENSKKSKSKKRFSIQLGDIVNKTRGDKERGSDGEEIGKMSKPEVVVLPEIHETNLKPSENNDLEGAVRKFGNGTLDVKTAKKYLSGEDLSESEPERQLRDLMTQLRIKQSGEAPQYSVEQQKAWNKTLSSPMKIKIQRPDITKFIKIETDQETPKQSQERRVFKVDLSALTKPIYVLGRKFKVSGNKFKSRNGSSKQSTGKTAGSSQSYKVETRSRRLTSI